MDVWFRAVVVVDVASTAHAIGEARGGRGRIDPQLRHMNDVLAHFGIEPVEFLAAVPGYPLRRLGEPTDPGSRSYQVKRAEEWGRQQAQSTDVPVRIVEGGTDGHHEIGVDDVAVALAIDRALDVRAGVDRHGADGLVVVSDDEDLEVIGSYTPGVATYIARRDLTKKQRARVCSLGNGYLRLGDAAFDQMAGGATQDLPPDVKLSADGEKLEAGGTPISSSLIVEPGAAAMERDAPIERAGTVAIVDAWGIATASARAIGLGRLPFPDDVQALLDEMSCPGPHAQLFVVPDVPDEVIARQLSGRRQKAWGTQDRELEGLIERLETDGLDETIVATARLAPERRKGHDPRRRHVVEKRTTALLTADLVYTLHRSPDARVVLVTDRPELEIVLHELHMLGAVDVARVTRVGIHAVVADIEPATATAALGSGHHRVTLTAGQLARLTRVDGRAVGVDLRQRLRHVLGQHRVTWQVARYDAVADGLVVHPEDDRSLEVTLCDFLSLDDGQIRAAFRDGVTTGGSVRLRVEFDPNRPCAIPSLRTDPHGGRRETIHTRYARVTERRGDRLRIDVDTDGLWDVEVDVGHDNRTYRPGDAVAVHETPDPAVWVLLGTDGQEEPSPPIPVEISSDVHGLCGRPVGSSGPWQPLTIPRGLAHRAGGVRRCLAVAIEEGRELLALSTELPHLEGTSVAGTNLRPRS